MITGTLKDSVKEAQEVIKKEFEENGLTDEVLKAQVKLNTIRHTLDVPDEDELLFEEYVQ